MDAAARFRIVAVAAFADGEPGEEEKLALVRIAQSMGLPLREAAHAMNEVAGGKAKILTPSDPKEKMQTFDAVLEIVKADGEISPRERELAHRLGRALGYDRRAIDDALAAPRRMTESGRLPPPV